ncbi:MAG TPA: ATPase, T2SS/T4P/T4SS family [Candidatus Acidoferrales bacterium]|jgi:type IV pilus assembly protein PilB|nr:ATPase, T2SS/T4P/T4SS family [Candidatus Acidoferrales bacterium]
MKRKRLGEVLQERKRITAAILQSAIEEQEKKTVLLGELLLERGLVSKDDLVAALEEVTRFRYVDPRFATVETAVLDLIPRSAALKNLAVPLVREGNRIIVVMAEPQNLHTIDELRFVSGMEISPRMGFRSEIQEAIEKCYADAVIKEKAAVSRLPFIEQVDVSGMQFFTASSSERNKAAMAEFEAEMRNEKTPAVLLVSAILSAAATKKASDIHIEPQANGTVVRIRVDGVLRELTHVPSEMQNALTSRVKILADMDIAERRVPQDGRFLVDISGRHLDLRVSSLPTHYGEKVVMRLLDSSATKVGFGELGFSEANGRALQSVLSMPQGMLLVTGPTGSGKSTTLYAALNTVRSPGINIITVEDPVEYKIEEVNQVQVNVKAGLTFATCLRSILRQDPNVIMVGEIRDAETAEIALQSAQTGHLVLSTLHTNDSVSAISRLLDLSIPAFLVASSVTQIVGQRLVRKLCKCKEQVAMNPEYASRLLAAGIVDFDDRMYVPIGCADCDNSGYRGRVGIYEVLTLDEHVRAAIRGSSRDEDIRNLARSGGMRLMQEDAMEKVKQGITTLDEAMRVVPFEHESSMRCRNCSKGLAPSFQFCPYCGAGARPVATERRATTPAPTGSKGEPA